MLEKPILEMEMPPNTEMVCLKCRAKQSFFLIPSRAVVRRQCLIVVYYP